MLPAEAILVSLLVLILIFVISSLPLYFAVKVLGGKTSLINSMLITLAAGVLVAFIQAVFHIWGSMIAFLFLIWLYHEAFRLKWIKSFLAWVLQMAFIAVFYFISIFLAEAFLGASLLSTIS